MDAIDKQIVKLREKKARSYRERSSSYSKAINNSWVQDFRNSVEEANIINSKVYTNSNRSSKYRESPPNSPEDMDNQTWPNKAKKSNEDVFRSCQEYLASNYEENEPRSDLTLRVDEGFVRERAVDCDVTIELTNSVYDDTNVTSSTPYPETSTEYASIFPMQYNSQRRKHKGRFNRGRRRRTKRVVCKNGQENVPARNNIPRKSIKYLRDMVNTVINSKWRFVIIFFVLSHFVFWLFFALIWFSVTNSYQDDYQDGKEHCVTGTSSFAGLLMLAVETQMTIGYGSRYPSEECPEAIGIMVVEIIAGTALSGGLSGLLFSKLVRPQKHLYSVGFSRRATVCLRDGQLCLLFRVWDLKNQHSISSSVTAFLLKPIRTIEGEHHQNFIHKLELKDANSFLIWPLTIVHIIDENSPLYDVSAKDLLDLKFEIVVCLTGSSLSMGTFTQSRTSFLSKEIIWGFRFVNVVSYSKKKEAYIIDEENLNTVEQVDTPLCSASRLKQVEEDCKGSDDFLDIPTSMVSSPNGTTQSDSPVMLRRNFNEINQ